MSEKIRIIASEQAWIEGEAVQQLENTAKLPGMQRAVGLPDLHPGKGAPIGAAFASEEMIYPYLLGNDIGCGMGLWQTDLKKNKIKLDKMVDKLTGLDDQYDGDIQAVLASHDLAPSPADPFLGTIGGGNHFVELQKVNEVVDQAAFSELGLDKKRLVLLVHSGSRGLGEGILQKHVAAHKAAGLVADSEEGREYLAAHDHALKWAKANRETISSRFLAALRADGEFVLDLPHNLLTQTEICGEKRWLHRKGAVPANGGPVVIPGSRGSLTYLVAPVGDLENALFSLAHGAGRKWQRSASRDRLRKKFSADSLRRTDFGSRVICEDKNLLYEEAPQAYKKIDLVINDLLAAGLIEIIATYQPVITYKRRTRVD
ncbi:MAG: RNA ligase RtcB family protein [Desulfobulbaceae bacterium]|nr:RNA ligase RtcB family protein [Desulfobulbaceae bacterium]